MNQANLPGRVATEKLGPLESSYYRNRIQSREALVEVVREAVEAWTAWALGSDYDDSPEPEHITKGRGILTAQPIKEYGCWVMVGWDNHLMHTAMMANGEPDSSWDDLGEQPRRTGEHDDDKWLALVNRALGTTYEYDNTGAEYRG